jgi:CBS domain-containing protein
MNTELRKLLAEKDSEVHTVTPDTSVVDAVRVMNHHNIGALLVLEGNTIVGIFTERDVLVRVVAPGLDPLTTAVREVMTGNATCVTSAMRVEEAMVLITRKRFRHLPVVENGQLRGLISSGDLTRWVVRDQQHQIEHLNAYITDTQVSSAFS